MNISQSKGMPGIRLQASLRDHVDADHGGQALGPGLRVPQQPEAVGVTRDGSFAGRGGGMSFAMTQKWTSRLLRKPRLVKEEVFLHSLPPDELATIYEALGRGLTPTRFSVEGSTVILQFDLDESRKPLQEE